MSPATPQRSYRAQVLAFLVAVIFWFLIKMTGQYEHTLEVPLKVTINNPDIVLKHPAPDQVLVEVQGRGLDLLQLSFYEFSYEVDLSDEQQREYVLNLSDHPEYVSVPGEVDVAVKSIVRPHEIRFDLDRRVTRRIPVRVRSDIDTENGFIVADVRPVPDSVVVTGPAAYVDTLSYLPTLLKRYEDVNLSIVETLDLIPDPRYFAEIVPHRVEATFDVQRLAEKTIRDVPVDVINVPKGYEAVPLPSMVTLYVKGGERILAEAGPDNFSVTIDYKRDWMPGQERCKARLETDLDVLYMESRPPEFELVVQKNRR